MSESNASLPDFIKTGMDFFKGNTVAKHLLDTAQSRITTLEQELTQARADLSTARASIKTEGDQVKDLQSQLTTKAEEIKNLQGQITTKDQEISTLKGNAKTGARQAADILSKTGIDPVSTEAPKSTELTKGFAELVKEQMTAGKTKAAAVQYVIAEFPDQYAEWKEAGAGKL